MADRFHGMTPFPVPKPLEKGQVYYYTNLLGDHADMTVEEAGNAGVTMISAGTNAGSPGYAGGPFVWDGGHRLYNLFTKEDVDEAEILRRVDKAHESGLLVIGELMRMWHPEKLYVEHPEWQERPNPDEPPRPAERMAEWPPVTGCWNSGFGDFYIRQNVEIARRLRWDGQNLDGFGCFTTCHCDACRESYRQDTGLEIPDTCVVGETSVEFGRYVEWRHRRYIRFVHKWVSALKAEMPDFIFLPWLTAPGRWWHWSFLPRVEGPEDVMRFIDAPIVELFWDFPPDQGNNLLPSFTVSLHRHLMKGKPFFMLPYFCTQGQQHACAPLAERRFRLSTAMAHGASCAIETNKTDAHTPITEYARYVAGRTGYTQGAQSVKWAAMVVSEASRLHYGYPAVDSRTEAFGIQSGVDTVDSTGLPAGNRRLPVHMESAVGVFRAFAEEHLPLDMIFDSDLEDPALLGQYAVILLPDAACLPAEAAENIRRFARAGGGVVALQNSSRFDELGRPQDDFSLGDLFGCRYLGDSDFSATWPFYYRQALLRLMDHPICNDPVVLQNMPRFTGFPALPGSIPGRVDYLGRAADVACEDEANVVIHRENDGQAHPFLVCGQFGAGKSAYFAADIGQAYFLSPYQYERRLIVNAAAWAASRPSPVTVQAPMCVQSTYWQRDGRWVIHLLNELNTGAARAIPEANPPMREEFVPVRGIAIALANSDVRKATLQPEGIDLAVRQTERGAEILVPELAMHSIVIAETK